MFSCSTCACRPAVALFNIKHFQTRTRVILNPATIREAFSTYLYPDDRLLRQSRKGNGSTRVLVLDKHHRVKGIYTPLLCLPHPAILTGQDGVLGLTIKDYLAALDKRALRGGGQLGERHTECGSSLATEGSEQARGPHDMTTEECSIALNSHKKQPCLQADAALPEVNTMRDLPSVAVILSHPHGFGVATFASDGSTVLPLQNVPISSDVSNTCTDLSDGVARNMSTYENGRNDHAITYLLGALNPLYIRHLISCDTFYYITRDNHASLSLDALRNAELYANGASKDNGERYNVDVSTSTFSERYSPEVCNIVQHSQISFLDTRWVWMPDLMLQRNRDYSLYTRDALTGQRVVCENGLYSAIKQGVLELDSAPSCVAP